MSTIWQGKTSAFPRKEKSNGRKALGLVKLDQQTGYKELVKQHKDKIERAGKYEVYLLDEAGHRIKKICGYGGLGNECRNSAGHGTVHKDYGYCKLHDKGGSGKFWVMFADEKKLPKTMSDYLKKAEKLEQVDLIGIDNDIKYQYALLAQVLHREDGDNRQVTSKEIDQASKIGTRIVEMKKARHTLEREAKLDITSVKEFITQFFGILEGYVQGHVLRSVFNDIMERVVMPSSTQRRIVDASEVDFKELHEMSESLAQKADSRNEQ